MTTTAGRTGESGYSLAELLIATAVIGMVGAAVLGIFQTSVAHVNQASSLEDAQSGARITLDRVTSELRLIGSYWSNAVGAGSPITAASASSLTFLGDIDGDSAPRDASGLPVETTLTATATATTLAVGANAGAFNTYGTAALNDYVHVAIGSVREVAQVTTVAASTITVASTLTKASSFTAGAIVRSVETVTYTYDAAAKTLTRRVGGDPAETLLDNVRSLTFRYYDSGGTEYTTLPANLGDIKEVQLTLTAESVGGSRRMMSSRARLRN